MKIFKGKPVMAPEITTNIFQFESKPHSFRHKVLVKSKNVKCINYGTHMESFVLGQNT